MSNWYYNTFEPLTINMGTKDTIPIDENNHLIKYRNTQKNIPEYAILKNTHTPNIYKVGIFNASDKPFKEKIIDNIILENHDNGFKIQSEPTNPKKWIYRNREDAKKSKSINFGIYKAVGPDNNGSFNVGSHIGTVKINFNKNFSRVKVAPSVNQEVEQPGESSGESSVEPSVNQQDESSVEQPGESSGESSVEPSVNQQDESTGEQPGESSGEA